MVVVVGAGVAGLVAAGRLAEAGRAVVLLDKGRSPGGRLATRRIGGATLDHGAQFFTVRTDELGRRVRVWEREGAVFEWCRGFSGDGGDGHPRYVVRGGMNALAKRLAAGLAVRCGTLVFAVRPGPGRWDVTLDTGEVVAADALIVTCPVPQTFALLVTAEVEVPADLATLDYDRTLALLAVLDRPPAVPAPGGVQAPNPDVTFVADHGAKGISAVPALTLHAAADWSLARWDDDRDHVHADLRTLAGPWLGGAGIIESQVKRWRFATPQRTWPQPCHTIDGGPAPLVLAGDAFAGPRVEGAFTSGLAAAEAVLAQ